MNLHPLFVHFPIALLVLYALIEIGLPLKVRIYRMLKWEKAPWFPLMLSPVWNSIKAFLVIAGTLFSFPTLQTGEVAEHIYREQALSPESFAQSTIGKLIEMHSTFATLSVILFSVLAVGYVAYVLMQIQLSNSTLKTVCIYVQKIVLHPVVAIMLSLAGLFAITITGALGGAIAHGPTTDPVVEMIYNWFF